MAKKVLFIIAFEGFRDEEYFEPRKILETNAIKVTTASSQLGTAQGKLGLTAKVDIALKDVDIKQFRAIIYIGGPGCKQYWDDPLAHRLAKQALANKKVIAAICSASVTLARAGLLAGKRATVFPGDAEHLKKEGANYTGTPVETDGLIITADGPNSASAFGASIVKLLEHIG